jgi:hypothetical protein
MQRFCANDRDQLAHRSDGSMAGLSVSTVQDENFSIAPTRLPKHLL